MARRLALTMLLWMAVAGGTVQPDTEYPDPLPERLLVGVKNEIENQSIESAEDGNHQHVDPSRSENAVRHHDADESKDS